MSEPVRKIKAPVHLEYTVTAGQVLSRFLAGVVEGRLIGRRCPSCHKVYVPPKGACPTCGVPCTEEVPVSDSGTVTTFCIVNVPFEGQTMKLPYVYASVILDGADLPLLHLIEVPADEARMGLRVKAEWAPAAERKPTLESIRWFVPTGEPDAAFDSYKEHLLMRDVAIVSFAQYAAPRTEHDEVEMLVPVITEAIERSGIPRKEIGFTVSGSCDYLGGRPFSFVMALDAVGAWPPISESHVEMDGAWALYEAWVRLQHGDIDAALVYAFGRSSQGDLRDILVTQLDPYYTAPLAPDWISLAALQARALIDAGLCTERHMAEIAARSRRNARTNPAAHVRGDAPVDNLMRAPYVVAPLREHDCPPVSDGVAAAVLVAGDRARKVSKRPAWIRGIDHRIEAHALGVRDLTRSPSTALAAKKAGVGTGPVDLAEIHAPFSHQEIILRDALGLDANVTINPSGGALGAHPFIVAGLNRVGEAARRIIDGSARRAVAHATSGPCLQQNLVCVLEGS